MSSSNLHQDFRIITLNEMWHTFKMYHKRFLISFLTIFVVGAIIIFLMPGRYEIIQQVEMANYKSTGKVHYLFDVVTSMAKINFVFSPYIIERLYQKDKDVLNFRVSAKGIPLTKSATVKRYAPGSLLLTAKSSIANLPLYKNVFVNILGELNNDEKGHYNALANNLKLKIQNTKLTITDAIASQNTLQKQLAVVSRQRQNLTKLGTLSAESSASSASSHPETGVKAPEKMLVQIYSEQLQASSAIRLKDLSIVNIRDTSFLLQNNLTSIQAKIKLYKQQLVVDQQELASLSSAKFSSNFIMSVRPIGIGKITQLALLILLEVFIGLFFLFVFTRQTTEK